MSERAASRSSRSSRSSSADVHIAKKYRVGEKLGHGAFGDIFAGVNIVTGQEVALKIESARAKHKQLVYEFKIYKILQGSCAFSRRVRCTRRVPLTRAAPQRACRIRSGTARRATST